MGKILNPYRPGAGLMPAYLAGRDDDIKEIEEMFKALTMNIPIQSVIFSGLRGVGKTVLINRLQSIANENDIFCEHIEVEERDDFIPQIVACAKVFLRQLSVKENLKNMIQKSLDALKSLTVSFDPKESTFSISVQEKELYTSTSLSQSLTSVFTSLGEAAYKSETPICFFIDEIQYMKQKELSALIAALHRANQLGYPIIVIGAGLPKIYGMLSEAKSYSERLFLYKEIGSLGVDQARKAIEIPVQKLKVSYSDEAANRIIEVTKGYPFFIQQFCKIIYNNSSDKIISLNDVNSSIIDFYKSLDTGFFRTRYERCTEADKRFIFAMVKCGELPCTITNIAEIMKKPINSISTSRAQLISKGIIYSVKFKELDFTVPEFSGFIRRLDEYKKWNEECK